MKIVEEKYLRNFDFWGGAKDWTDLMYPEELDKVEIYLEELFEVNTTLDLETVEIGIKEIALNDIFWFDFEQISEILWDIDNQEDAWEFLNNRAKEEKEKKYENKTKS